jgi:tetratricopeptide (TPR) repeat protein/tRNA A-37 threonylcarbamoyl transferase component Bud32
VAEADDTLDQARSADTLTMVDGQSTSAHVLAPLELGATLGRYLVIEKLGEGGMGVVVRAYDPKLHREIALKRLHRDALDSDGEARLLREAQAMAQLSHPNVITIHDVERTEDGVVMAMEYVEGQTLAQWIEAGPHPWPQVLERFGQAGEGLLAAHRAGLVHRDFKPSNAILGPNGRVRVMDFGLARAEPSGGGEAWGAVRITDLESEALAGRDTSPSSSSVGPSSSGSVRRTPSIELTGSGSLSLQLTEAGAVMGTPAYMAPEQHRGEVADARSDQYAFCVSLWEGLWGERPFRGDFRGIVLVKHRGPPPMPRTGKVPRWVYEALRRGLRPKPAERWPSMAELLEALAADPARRRRRWLAAGATVAVVAGLGGAVAWQGTRERPCTDASAELVGVWDDDRRAQVEAALQGTKLGYAEITWARTAERLDAYAEQWVQQHTEACEATAVHKVQSAALLDLRMQCLRRRKLHLLAVVDVLAGADAEVAETAIQQVTSLPPLDRCADADALMAEVPPPEHPQVARAVEQLRDELTRATALSNAGRYDDAQALVGELHARSIPLEHDPIEAEVLELGATIADLQGDFPRAVEQGTRAYELALRTGATGLAAEAAMTLLFVTGHRQGHVDVGRAWATSALALAQRADPSGAKEGMALNGLGVLAYRGGDFAGATVYFERALPMLVRAQGEEHDQVATTLNHLGAMLDEQGRYAEAEPHFRRALAIQTAVFGPEHPRRTISMDNLALCMQAQGRNEDARELHLQALELRRRTLGQDHPDTALTENNLGWDYMGLHQPDTAADHFARALAGFEAAHGLEHRSVAMAAESLALAELERGRHDEAEALHHRALTIRRKTLGEDHPNVALSLGGLGTVAHQRGRYAEAVELHQQALAIIEAKKEGAERYLGDILVALGKALVEQGRFGEARAHLERAVTLREASTGIDPVVEAEARLLLARARWGEGDDPEAARAQAREALASLAGNDGESAKSQRAELERWLATHD